MNLTQHNSVLNVLRHIAKKKTYGGMGHIIRQAAVDAERELKFWKDRWDNSQEACRACLAEVDRLHGEIDILKRAVQNTPFDLEM